MTSDTPLQPEHEQPHGGFASVSVAAILAESAERHADRVAVVVGDVSTTYRELWDETRAYAGALRDRGVGEGTRVAMLIPNVADFPRVYYAVLALGGVVVPVHALLKSEEIAYVLRDSGSALQGLRRPAARAGREGRGARRRAGHQRARAGLHRGRARPARGARAGRDAHPHLRAASAVGHRDDPLHLRHHRPADGRGGQPPRARDAGRRAHPRHLRPARRRSDPRLPAPVPHLRPDLHHERVVPGGRHRS